MDNSDEIALLRSEITALRKEIEQLKSSPKVTLEELNGSQSRRKVLKKLAFAAFGVAGVAAVAGGQTQNAQAIFEDSGDQFWGFTAVPNASGDTPRLPGSGKFGVIGATEATINLPVGTPAALQYPANINTGIYGMSARGYGVTSRGTTANMYLVPGTSAGAPTGGNHLAGEMLTASNGQLYYCTASGTPGTWVKLTENISLLPASVRVAATTNVSGGTRPLLTAQGPTPVIGNSSTTQIQITGVGGIPAGAKGCVGVLTNVGATGGGNLRFWTGGAAPNSVNLNIPGALPSLNLSASFSIPLDVNGRVYLGFGTGAGTNGLCGGYFRLLAVIGTMNDALVTR
jgi:hypothetical protein